MSLTFPGTATILNVDDNEDGRVSLSWLLRSYGFDVWEAATGGDALRLARDKPDLVLLDVVLPDMDGFHVCQHLRADPATAMTPILMLSGRAIETADRVHGLEDGADCYLTKPVAPEELLAHAKALLRVRRAEDRLRRSQELFRTFMDNSPAVAFIKGEDGRYLYANRRWEEQFCPPCRDWSGRTDSAFWSAEAARQSGEAEAAALASNRPVERVEVVQAPGGEVRHLVVLRFPVWDADGKRALAGVAVDVTERHRLEEQFRQAQKLEAVGRLAGGIAHDFNNLLTVINGYSELALASLPKDDPSRPLVEEIQKAGDRAAGLTRQLLAFSRRQILQQRAFDLNGLLADLNKMLERVIGEDVALVTDFHHAALMVTADAGQVEQVVMNLAVNARDAMPRGGRLVIRTQPVSLDDGVRDKFPEVRPGGYVRMSVVDTGHGMEDEVLARIWEPFFTTKPQGQGTGLGLATVYGIVKGHGGHVEVESRPGRGTTFHVYLPVSEDRRPEPAQAAQAEVMPRGTETVLLVEDEEGVRSLARRVLEELGYRVVEADSGGRALAVASGFAEPMHLLLTDVVMPEMGGQELVGRLRAGRPEMKVLFMSGYTDDAVIRHGIQSAEVAFLQKPFTATVLANRVREVLDQASVRS